MQAKFIGVLEGEDKTLSASLYQLPNDEYVLWLKVGIGIVEIKQSNLDEVLFYLTEMKNIIENGDPDE